MSILTAEYDIEIAKKVYGEELLEDVVIELLHEGMTIEKIAKVTKLPIETIKEIQRSM